MVPRIVVLALVAVLSLTLVASASAGVGGAAPHGGFHGSGFQHSGLHGTGFHRGAFRDGFHRRQGFSRFGCCFGPALVGGAFLDAADAAAYYNDPYPVYPAPPADQQAPLYPAPPPYQAPPAPPIFCYVGGCYHLQGNGVNLPYQWVWVPDVPAGPPPPPPGAPKI
jgi:hypothetical protein